MVLGFIHSLKTEHSQHLKGMRSSKLDFLKKLPTKGVPFLSKMEYKRVRG